MLEWIKTITSSKSIAVSFGTAFSIWWFSRNFDNNLWFTVVSFIIVFVLYDPIIKLFQSIKLRIETHKKLSLLSNQEKSIVKQYIDKDRRELRLNWSDENVKRLEEKQIIDAVRLPFAMVSGTYNDSDNYGDFYIDENFFNIAKKYYKTLLGAH